MSIICYENVRPKISNDIANTHNDLEIASYYNNSFRVIKRDTDCRMGVCYNYALKDYKLEWEEDIERLLKSQYKKINLEEVERGDIVTYYVESIYDFPSHFAVVLKGGKTLNDIIIRSKWGNMGIFERRLDEVPEMYGTKILFWRKKV